MSDVVIGVTVVGAGQVVAGAGDRAVQAQRPGEPDLLVGNPLGSNLFNSVLAGAVVGLAAYGGGAVRGADPAGAVMVGVNALPWLLPRYRVSRMEAGVLLGTYLAAVLLLL